MLGADCLLLAASEPRQPELSRRVPLARLSRSSVHVHLPVKAVGSNIRYDIPLDGNGDSGIHALILAHQGKRRGIGAAYGPVVVAYSGLIGGMMTGGGGVCTCGIITTTLG